LMPLLVKLCSMLVGIAIEKTAIVAATGTIFDLFILVKYSIEFIIFQQNKYFEIMIGVLTKTKIDSQRTSNTRFANNAC
jgi:hypothetical protein